MRGLSIEISRFRVFKGFASGSRIRFPASGSRFSVLAQGSSGGCSPEPQALNPQLASLNF